MSNSIKLGGNNYWDTSGLHGCNIFNYLGSISGNSSKTFNVPNSFRGLLLLYRGSSTMGAYMVYSTSGGSVYTVALTEGTNMTITTSTNSLTVTLSSNSNTYAYFIGSGGMMTQ